MKRLAILLLSSFLMVGSRGFAQTIAANRISRTEAVRIVSQLAVGMQQVEVRKVLERNGFGEVSGALGRHSCFLQQDPLADGYALELEYMPTNWSWSTNNNILLRIKTSRLQQATILSNGVPFMSINLTNAP